RKVLVLPDARRKGTAADAARCAMKHRTVGRIAARVVPALHAAGKALALAHAAHIDKFAGFEILNQHAVADFRLVFRIRETNFAQHPNRSDTRLLEVACQRLVHTLRLDKLHKAQLDSLVTVSFTRAPLHYNTGPSLQNCATHKVAVFCKDLRHSQLDSDNSVNRHFLFSLFRSLSAPGEYWLRTA